MEIIRLPFDQVPQLSSRDKAYANQDPKLRPFFKYPVSLDAFEQVIADKSTATIDRALLVEVLQKQYASLASSPLTQQNIEALQDERTFTVVTAHQPSLFTGPLYYIYKICSTIHLAKALKEHYPSYQFVPVFITGGEDHDFEEVNHMHLFGKTVQWENNESGAVAMMQAQSLRPALAELKDILGTSENAQEIYHTLEKAYTSHETYGPCTIDYVNALFKEDGLVVIDMNDRQLKRAFIPYIKKEIFEQPSQSLVEQTTADLEAAGFSGQAFPREINFFYLQDQSRERIVEEEGQFKVLNTTLSFTKEGLEAEIEAHPERFSPNVVMRPLYQEVILPNLAYIGGGGELAYWLERQRQFEHFEVNFPMLIRRNSVLWIDKGNAKRMDKLNLELGELFEEVEGLIKQYVKQNTDNEISLKQEKKDIKLILDRVQQKAEEVDPTLIKATKAEIAKLMNSLSNLENKLMRAEKQRHDIAINQIRTLNEKLFPGGGLQERYDNFLGLYLKYGDAFFETLKQALNPLEKGFIVIIDR